jgi:hypothetical protein
MNLTQRPAQSLIGRVIDEQGRPIENATIQLRNLDYLDSKGHEYHRNYREFDSLTVLPEKFHQTHSDADGRFEIKGLPAESVTMVMIEHADFAEQWLLAALSATPMTTNRFIANSMVTIKDDKQVSYPIWETRSVRTSPLEIRARATRQILIDVVHDDDGTSAEGVTVSASTAVGANSEAMSSGKTDEKGRVALKLPLGKYKLFLSPVRTSDYLLTKRELVVDDQTSEQPLKHRVDKGCILTFEVLDADTGKGIPGISFVKEFRGTSQGTSHYTDDTGECRAIVAPGTHRYSIAYAEGYPGYGTFASKQVVDCEAGKTARVQFKLRK